MKFVSFGHKVQLELDLRTESVTSAETDSRKWLALASPSLPVAPPLFHPPRPLICPPGPQGSLISCAVQCCPLLAVYLPVGLHVGVVLVEPEGQVEDGVRGPLFGHLSEPLGQAAAQVLLQVLRVHAAGQEGGRAGDQEVRAVSVLRL